jgi:dihydrodipicolinate synthase/N-acetylneuraminate lyase
MKDGWRGIISIAASPFDENGTFLFDELERHVDWIVRAGAHVAWPLGYSEFPSLSHAERIQGTKAVVEAVAGRAVCLIGVSAQCRQQAADYARRAAECGADGVVALLPRGFSAANYPLIKAYYAEIAAAAGLPVFIQNVGAPWAGLSAETIVRLCRDIDEVEYVKEEKSPEGRSCQEIIDLCGDDMSGVFSGGGGFHLISEMERGVSGCFPGAPVTVIVVQVWDLWHKGEKEQARALSNLHAAYGRIWQAMIIGARKHLLVRRGVISTAFERNKGHSGIAVLDATESAELDYALSLLEPYFTV